MRELAHERTGTPFSTHHEEATNQLHKEGSATLKDDVSQIAKVLSAPIVMS